MRTMTRFPLLTDTASNILVDLHSKSMKKVSTRPNCYLIYVLLEGRVNGGFS